MIVTEAIYDLRESHNCPRTFDTYFSLLYLIKIVYRDWVGTQNVASEMELLLSWPVWPLQPVIPFPVRHPSSPPGRESEGERERERESDRSEGRERGRRGVRGGEWEEWSE